MKSTCLAALRRSWNAKVAARKTPLRPLDAALAGEMEMVMLKCIDSCLFGDSLEGRLVTSGPLNRIPPFARPVQSFCCVDGLVERRGRRKQGEWGMEKLILIHC